MQTSRAIILGALCLVACVPPAPEADEPSPVVDSTAAGFHRVFHPDGRIRAEVPVKEGLQDGTLTEYYPDGRVKAVQGWQRGRPFGEHKVYAEDGTLVYHAVRTYEDLDDAQFLAYSVLLNDSTRSFSTANRVVITDLAALLTSVRVEPDSALRFGVDNKLRIVVPNVPSFSPSVQHGIISKGGHEEAWVLRPTVRGKDVVLTLSAQVNDSTLEFAPVTLPVR
jgi:hypothetical protein